MSRKQTIFVTWFPLYHGLAFIKNILAAFYDGKVDLKNKINVSGLVQEEMEQVFYKKTFGFMFDRVYIITPTDEVFFQITSGTFKFIRRRLEGDEIINNSDFADIWYYIFENLEKNNMQQHIDYVKENYPDKVQEFIKLYWRVINYLGPSQQEYWLKNYSNLPKEYKDRFEFIKAKDLKPEERNDYEKVLKLTAKCVEKITQKHKNARFVINTGLQTPQFTIAWFLLANAGKLPKDTRLIEAYDIKNSRPDHKFQKFYIKEYPGDLISGLSEKISLYVEPKTKVRKIANLKFQTFLNQGFAILLLGERGTGKSHIVNKYAHNKNLNLVAANCASFIDSHIAESELFGYEKGAFTGASREHKGLIEQADGGILFLDEIHTLPKDMQFKLMRAFATDEENRMTIRRLGSTKEKKITLKALILATNKTIDELRDLLLPDFYDRIVQLVVDLPPLRRTPEEIIPAFMEIWQQLRFELLGYPFPDNDKALLNWVKSLPLFGNYRDLQRIAMNYKAYLEFSDELKKLLPYKNALEYTKEQFRKYMLNAEASQRQNQYFSTSKTPQQMITEFKRDLANWAIEIFGSAQKAVKHFDRLGEKITKETLYNWRNAKVD